MTSPSDVGRTTMVSVRLPAELHSRLKAEAAKCNEPVSRTMLRKLEDYEGWKRRNGVWDCVR